MYRITTAIFVVAIALTFVQCESPPKKIIQVALGGHCALGAAPVGPGGSWQVVEKNVEKQCAAGSSCRRGACNCDDLHDGTVMSLSQDANGDQVCRRISGQKCSADKECFKNVPCVGGKCFCDEQKDPYCVTSKLDVTIMS